MKKLLAAAALAVLVSCGGRIGPRHSSSPNITYLSAVALNGAAATRTWQINDALGWATAVLFVEYTHANNGALTVTCTASDDANTTDFTLQTCTISGGACTLNDAGTYATGSLTGDKDYTFRVGLLGYDDVECVIAHGGAPDANDLVTVTGYLVTQ